MFWRGAQINNAISGRNGQKGVMPFRCTPVKPQGGFIILTSFFIHDNSRLFTRAAGFVV